MGAPCNSLRARRPRLFRFVCDDETKPTDAIAQIKQRVEAKTGGGVPASTQELTFEGAPLDNHAQSLGEYGVPDGGVLRLTPPAPLGGDGLMPLFVQPADPRAPPVVVRVKVDHL